MVLMHCSYIPKHMAPLAHSSMCSHLYDPSVFAQYSPTGHKSDCSTHSLTSTQETVFGPSSSLASSSFFYSSPFFFSSDPSSLAASGAGAGLGVLSTVKPAEQVKQSVSLALKQVSHPTAQGEHMVYV